jgi:hypothetical protein
MAQLEQQELNELKQLQQNQDKLIFQLGQVLYSRIRLDEEEAAAKKQMELLRKQESEILGKLTAKYGVGNIDIETGQISSAN